MARASGSTDLEMLGRAVGGLALVASGAVAEGMRALDEVNAAVVAGELKDLVVIGLCCCYMISACERVRDYDRALQWCTRLTAFCAKWGLRPLFAVCRSQYATICMWPLSSLGCAELAFDRGDMRSAADQVARYLRRVPPRNRTDRAAGLDLLVRALVGAGDLEAAKTAHAELQGIAVLVGTTPVRAAASLTAGYIGLGSGAMEEARRSLEDAVDLFLQSGAPYEVARARLELARALGALGQIEAARQEIQRAIDLLVELKAELEISRARALLESLSAKEERPHDGARASRPDSAGLTGRELEVLRLVARGLSNQVIGERLFVSEHTVHRHLANIFAKLSVSSRAAAVAQAARRGILN